MKKILALSDEQEGKIREIMKVRSENIRAIHRENAPRIMKEFEDMRKEVSAVLNDEQRKKWEEECKNKMKRFKGHFRRKPGHYPGKHRFTKPMPKQPHS